MRAFAHHHVYRCAAGRLLLAAVTLVAPAVAQPQPSPAPAAAPATPLGDLTDILRSLEDPALPPDRRAALIDRSIEVRARLIEAAPGDERAPTWMVDQSAALLDRLAGDGGAASVLLGIPTAPQRDRARADAMTALELTSRADQAAAATVRTLQARVLDTAGKPVEAARAEAAHVEEVLARLIDEEQGVRIPYYRGRAASLLAALQAGESGRALREEHGRVALESLAQLALGTTASESVRRVTLGSVLLTLWGRDDKPRAQAHELFGWVASRPAGAGADAPDALTRAAAHMGLVRCARGEAELRDAVAHLAAATRTEPFVIDGSTDPLLALLAAEGAAAAMLADLPREPDHRARWIDEALMPLVALTMREDLRADEPALRPAVMARLSAACDALGDGAPGGAGASPVPFDRLHPLVAFARGIALAQRPGGAEAAAALLLPLTSREDAGDLRAEALWELAVMHSRSAAPADAVRAVEALCRLAKEFPESARAPEAALRAVELSRYTLGRASREAGLGAEVSARLTALYGEALELTYTLRASDAETPARRLERARVVLEAAGESLTPDQLDTALDALEGVRPGEADSPALRAAAEQMGAAAVETALSAARRAVAQGGAVAAVGEARQRLIAAARRAVQWAQQVRPSHADSYRLILGEALLDAGDARALALYEELTPRLTAKRGADVRRAALGLARAQRLGGRGVEAFTGLRSLVEEVDNALASNPGAATRPPEYWSAWAEMLEIIAAEKPPADRVENVRVQVGRLRLLDPSLGGDATRMRIESAARSIGATP